MKLSWHYNGFGKKKKTFQGQFWNGKIFADKYETLCVIYPLREDTIKCGSTVTEIEPLFWPFTSRYGLLICIALFFHFFFFFCCILSKKKEYIVWDWKNQATINITNPLFFSFSFYFFFSIFDAQAIAH